MHAATATAAPSGHGFITGRTAPHPSLRPHLQQLLQSRLPRLAPVAVLLSLLPPQLPCGLLAPVLPEHVTQRHHVHSYGGNCSRPGPPCPARARLPASPLLLLLLLRLGPCLPRALMPVAKVRLPPRLHAAGRQLQYGSHVRLRRGTWHAVRAGLVHVDDVQVKLNLHGARATHADSRRHPHKAQHPNGMRKKPRLTPKSPSTTCPSHRLCRTRAVLPTLPLPSFGLGL